MRFMESNWEGFICLRCLLEDIFYKHNTHPQYFCLLNRVKKPNS
jgi:hypothetical protein